MSLSPTLDFLSFSHSLRPSLSLADSHILSLFSSTIPFSLPEVFSKSFLSQLLSLTLNHSFSPQISIRLPIESSFRTLTFPRSHSLLLISSLYLSSQQFPLKFFPSPPFYCSPSRYLPLFVSFTSAHTLLPHSPHLFSLPRSRFLSSRFSFRLQPLKLL